MSKTNTELTRIATVTCLYSLYFASIRTTLSLCVIDNLLLCMLLGRCCACIRNDSSYKIPEAILHHFLVVTYPIGTEQPYSEEAEGEIQCRQAEVHTQSCPTVLFRERL